MEGIWGEVGKMRGMYGRVSKWGRGRGWRRWRVYGRDGEGGG